MTKRWKQRPPGSTWGDWGEEDELGRINLLTPEKVLQGVREVEAGISFCLSLPLDFPGGTALNQRRHPPVLAPTEDMKARARNPETAGEKGNWVYGRCDERGYTCLNKRECACAEAYRTIDSFCRTGQDAVQL